MSSTVERQGKGAAEGAEKAVFASFADWQREQMRLARREDALRWGLSFLAVLAVSGGVVWWITRLPPPVVAVPEPPPAAIAIDMAPEPVSTPTPPTDLPPGPQQTQSIPDPAPVEPPKVTAPPSPAPNPPVPVPKPEKPKKIVKKHKPAPMLEKPIPDKTPPAETTTAPPSSDVPPAPTQAAPAPGASSAKASHDPVTWQGALLAQLEKFKRYPSDAWQTVRKACRRSPSPWTEKAMCSRLHWPAVRAIRYWIRRRCPFPNAPSLCPSRPIVLLGTP